MPPREYEKEDIEKYKLLSDPDFAKYYYSSGTGDIYYINSFRTCSRKEIRPGFTGICAQGQEKS